MTDNAINPSTSIPAPPVENIPAVTASPVDEAKTAKDDTTASHRTPLPTSPNHAPSAASVHPLPTSKDKPKVRRARPRRRVASSDAESDDQAASDNSLTENSASDFDTDSDEEDEDAVEDAIGDHHSVSAGSGHSHVDSKPTPVFAGTDTTTPAAWTDLHAPTEEISFEDFNRGGRGKPIRGRGTGRGAAPSAQPREKTQPAGSKDKKQPGEVADKRESTEDASKKSPAEPKERKEFTEAQKKKFEEKKARMKERQKAKRAVVKEAKEKEKAAAPKPVNGSVEVQPDLARPAPASKQDNESKQADSVVNKSAPEVKSDNVLKADELRVPVADRQDQKASSSTPSSQPTVIASPKTAKSKPAKGKGRNKPEATPQPSVPSHVASASLSPPNISTLVASTSALTVDDPSQSITADDQLQAPSSLAISPPPAETGVEDWAAPLSSERPRPPRVNNREAYAQRIAEDPKFTPRVGQFWTHDQRHYDAGPVGDGGYSGLRQMSDYWRGRGSPRGGLRGGFRGRGRGGFGPQSPLGRSDNFGEEVSPVKGAERRGAPKLAMDRVEIELDEARDRARAAKDQTQVQDEPADDGWPIDPIDSSAILPPPISAPGNKWGHEAFEAVQATEQSYSQSARGAFRARGRGRGLGRGGHFNPPPIHPAAGLPTPVATPEPPAAAFSSSPSRANASNPVEELLTQPAAEDLLATSTEAVTVRLPGADPAVPTLPALGLHDSGLNGLAVPVTSAASTGQDRPYTPSAPVDTAEPYLKAASIPTEPPASAPFRIPQNLIDAPAPVASPQYASITGSENGSMSSTGHFVSQQFQTLPPGIGLTPSGEFYNLATGAPVDFRPPVPPSSMRNFFAPQQGSFQPPQGFSPIPTYSPDPFAQHQRDSFSAAPVLSPQAMYYPGQPGPPSANGMNGYPDGRGSPYGNPYAASNGQAPNGQVSGYFAPARQSSKVVIRAPSSNAGERAASSPPAKMPGPRLKAATNGFTPQGQMPVNGAVNGGVPFASVQQAYFSQHYNPYTGMNGYDGADPSGRSGMGTIEGHGMIQGQQQGMFYPDQSQYGWQQQQEAYATAAYGYSGGEYPGY